MAVLTSFVFGTKNNNLENSISNPTMLLTAFRHPASQPYFSLVPQSKKTKTVRGRESTDHMALLYIYRYYNYIRLRVIGYSHQ